MLLWRSLTLQRLHARLGQLPAAEDRGPVSQGAARRDPAGRGLAPPHADTRPPGPPGIVPLAAAVRRGSAG